MQDFAGMYVGILFVFVSVEHRHLIFVERMDE